MTGMTTSDQLRDTAGRFAAQQHSAPEQALDADTLTPEQLTQNADGHYGWEAPLIPLDDVDEGERQSFVETFIDDYFAQPEPATADGGIDLFDETTWQTPF